LSGQGLQPFPVTLTNWITGNIQRDHIMPIALGGSSDIINIQLLCQPCNSKNGANNPIEYANKIGYLL